jgi:hypothetical protein
MSHWSREAAVSRYGFILDRLGLSGDEVAGLSAVTPASGEPDVFGYDTVDERVPGTVLHDRLVETLVESSRGFEAPRRYWNELPSIQLQEVLERHDTDFLVDPNHDGETAISPPDGRATTLGVRDRVTGANEYAQFEYPDTALEDDNYPALVDAVQSNLLDDTSLRFVRLVDDGDCWRFLLVERERLAALTTEFGDRIDLRGRPLLAAHQPPAYNQDVATDETGRGEQPPELVDEANPSAVRRLFEEAASASFETLVEEADATADADADFDHGASGGVDVDELVEADDPVATAEKTLDATDPARTAERTPSSEPTDATVEDLDALFADLDENTLDSNDDDTDIRAQTASTSQTGSATSPSTSGATPATASTDRAEPDRRSADIAALAASANVDWDVDESLQSDAPDGSDLDAVFEGLERDAAMSTFAGSTTTDDDQVTSTDLLSVVDDETIDADDEFDWLDASELERAPDAIADAAAIDLDPKAPRST